jgi:hypothetical protein
LILIGGCHGGHDRQCAALIAKVNAADAAIAHGDGAASAKAMAGLAQSIEHATVELSALKLPDDGLRRRRDDHLAVLRRIAEASRQMNDAARKQDTEKIRAVRDQLEAAARDESAVVQGINHDCAGAARE